MSDNKQLAEGKQEQPSTRVAPRSPPPLAASRFTSPEDALAKTQAREQRDAQVRGVTSIHAMRNAIRAVSRDLPAITSVPRTRLLDAAAFRQRAAEGLPFLVTGLVNRWPLASLTPQTLRERFSHLQVRARVGDYINTAFAPDRAMQDMSMLAYLDLVDSGAHALPPYRC
jgi:hypothetical protein